MTIANHLYIYFMERFLIFMYRHYSVALFLSFMASVICSLCTRGVNAHLSVLPFLLLVTFYYVSMLAVRKLYQKKDEVRRRAHYIRWIFRILTVIIWLIWLTSYLVYSLES